MNTSATISTKSAPFNTQKPWLTKVARGATKKEILFENPADFASLPNASDGNPIPTLVAMVLSVGVITWIVTWSLKNLFASKKNSPHEPEDHPF